MSEIPADIQETARAVFSDIASVDWVEAERIIAKALMAERKRSIYLTSQHQAAATSSEYIAKVMRSPSGTQA